MESVVSGGLEPQVPIIWGSMILGTWLGMGVLCCSFPTCPGGMLPERPCHTTLMQADREEEPVTEGKESGGLGKVRAVQEDRA